MTRVLDGGSDKLFHVDVLQELAVVDEEHVGQGLVSSRHKFLDPSSFPNLNRRHLKENGSLEMNTGESA